MLSLQLHAKSPDKHSHRTQNTNAHADTQSNVQTHRQAGKCRYAQASSQSPTDTQTDAAHPSRALLNLIIKPGPRLCMHSVAHWVRFHPVHNINGDTHLNMCNTVHDVMGRHTDDHVSDSIVQKGEHILIHHSVSWGSLVVPHLNPKSPPKP